MREVVRGVGAAMLAYAVMAGVAAAGLRLAGAGGSLARLTAATVAMAGGGRLQVTGVLRPPGGMPPGSPVSGGMDLRGAVHVMPLGVSLAGVIVLVALLRSAPVVRLAGAAVALPAALAVSAFLGHGRVTVRPPCAAYVKGCGESRAFAQAGITLAYETGVWRALFTGLALTLVVLALLLGLGRTSWVRPAASAALTVTAWVALAAELAAPLAALRGGPRAVGAALLLAPDAAFAALSAGVGTPWSAGRTTSGGDLRSHGLAVIFAVAVLLVVGVLAAARTRVPPGPAWRRGLTCAARLSPVTAVIVAGTTLLAGASAHLGVSVLGFAFPVIGLHASGDILVALVLGAAAGAVAGFVGSVVLEVPGLVRVWRRTW